MPLPPRRPERTAGRSACSKSPPSHRPRRTAGAPLPHRGTPPRSPATPCASPRRPPSRTPLLPEVLERLRGILQIFRQRRRLARRHGRRQINDPMWIGGEAAHHFQRRDRILLANRDLALQFAFRGSACRSRPPDRARRRVAAVRCASRSLPGAAAARARSIRAPASPTRTRAPDIAAPSACRRTPRRYRC